MPSRFQLRHNLTILGAPGSGKGFYGRPLADAWRVPVWTASTILQRLGLLKSSSETGQLLDDDIVSQAILHHLQETQRKESQHVVLDGFPRTIRQVQLMELWPRHHRVSAAFHLDVPDFVCRAKLLGRRYCPICQTNWNLANVDRDGFDLPPQLPHNCTDCHGKIDWTQRPDDTADVIETRLQIHHQHEAPLLEYFGKGRRLLSLRPYHGAKDLPHLRASLETWLDGLELAAEE